MQINDLRNFWKQKQLNNSSYHLTVAETSICEVKNEVLKFNLKCIVLAIIEKRNNFVLKIWDGTKAHL